MYINLFYIYLLFIILSLFLTKIIKVYQISLKKKKKKKKKKNYYRKSLLIKIR